MEIDINNDIFDKKYVLYYINTTHINQKGKHYQSSKPSKLGL